MKTLGACLVLIAMLCPMMTAGEQISEQPKRSRLWRWSVVAVALSNTLDISSSIGGRETNPVLGTGTFGPRAAGIKAGLVVGSIVFQRWLVQRHSTVARPLAFGNLAVSAGLTAIAVHNFGVPRNQPPAIGNAAAP